MATHPEDGDEDSMAEDWDGFDENARRRQQRGGRGALREVQRAIHEARRETRRAAHAAQREGRRSRAEVRREELEESQAERNERRRERRKRRRSELSPEERAYREAARRAEAKLRFVQHLVPYVFVVLLLAFVARPVAVIVALGWGVGLASHFFRAFVMPDLRKRWVRNEVDHQVHQTVSRERIQIEGRQLRSLEELSASIAHEIRNPITAAKSLVQQMGEDPTSGDNVEYARVALEELGRVERSISHLLRYARDEDMRTEEVHLAEVVTDAVSALRDRIDKLGVEIVPELDTVGVMEGDPEKLRRIVLNLVGNGIDALEEAHTSSPRIEVGVGDNLAGDGVWLKIRDNGPGMDDETQHKIFRPFFTSKANGTGLGLAISKKLVDAHGGVIEIDSSPGKGCEFVLSFPKLYEASVTP